MTLASVGANVVRAGTTEAVAIAATIAGDSVGIGSTFRARAAGTITVLGNPTIRLRVGSTGTPTDPQAWIASAPLTGVLNTVVHVEMLVTVKALGTAGKVAVEGFVINGVTMLNRAPAAPALVTVDTTRPWSISLTSAMSTASGAITWTTGFIERRY